MPLIELKTQFKDKKYGQDKLGGGSSNQPYIKTTIPENISDIGNTGGPDFLIRGGTNSFKRSGQDVARFMKFIFDTKSPNGFLFVSKQEILAKQQSKFPSTIFPSREYNPLNAATQILGGAYGLHFYGKGNVPTHLNINNFTDFISQAQKGNININDGLNALSQTSIDKSTLYYNQIKKNYNSSNTNKLALLYESKLLNIPSSNSSVAKEFGIDLTDPLNLFKFMGGPQSILGLGNSIYKRVTNTEEWLDLKKTTNINYSSYSQKQLNEKIPIQRGETVNFEDFREKLIDSTNSTYLTFSNYSVLNRNTYGIGDPGKRTRIRNSSSFDSTTTDLINFTRLSTEKPTIPDLIDFYIISINNDNPTKNIYIPFRAFLKGGITDAYTSDWSSHKFMGRGEEFYTYAGYKRNLSLAFSIHAQSEAEMEVLYSKLNYLVSLMTPDYNQVDGATQGFMRSNLIKLTIGDYLNEVPGIITNLNLTIPEESPWDIGRDKEGQRLKGKQLPHLIEVSNFSFTPIQSFLPKKVKFEYIDSQTLENLDSNYISMGKNG